MLFSDSSRWLRDVFEAWKECVHVAAKRLQRKWTGLAHIICRHYEQYDFARRVIPDFVEPRPLADMSKRLWESMNFNFKYLLKRTWENRRPAIARDARACGS